jgi:hypothetical protein
MRVRRRAGLQSVENRNSRRGAVSTLDYILVIGVILPLAAIVLPTGMRMARAAYDMLSVFVAWPFL